MKAIRSIKSILSLFLKRQFSRGLHALAGELPDWLFQFNKAWIIYTESFRFPRNLNPEVHVHIADESDIDDISRVSRRSKEHIRSLMRSGATCFVGNLTGARPSAVTWGVCGRCYIRGMGFEYDFGPQGCYCFFGSTLPEARGKGIFLCLAVAREEFELDHGVKCFYALVEFTNEYAHNMLQKLGYRPVLGVIFVSILGVKVCHVRDLTTGKSSLQVRLRQPRGKVTII